MSVGSGTTSTVTFAAALVPLAPAHVSEKIVVPANRPELCEPLKGLAPLQPPDAVQLAAFDELHVKVVAAPLMTLLCEALIDAVGGGSGADEPPPPQDVSSSRACAAVRERIENCMR